MHPTPPSVVFVVVFRIIWRVVLWRVVLWRIVPWRVVLCSQNNHPSCATLTMAPHLCTCRHIVDGNRLWYDLLNDDNKDSLPDDFVTVVHNTVRDRGLVYCGGISGRRGK